jgi:hypothetical protein
MTGGGVAVLVNDSGEALRAARYGARLARAWQRPLLLVVPLPATRPAGDLVLGGPAAGWRDRAADLLLPVLSDRALQGLPVHVRGVAAHIRTRRSRPLAAALDVARRMGAGVLVVGPRAAGTGPGRGVVLLDPETGRVADGQPPPEMAVGRAG